MEEILLLVYGEELREVDVAKRLSISKQAVSKALREARGRLAQIFLTIADLMYADIIRVNIEKGYAIIKLRQTKQKAYVFYVPTKGPRVIFENPINLDKNNVKLYEEIVETAIKWRILRNKNLKTKDLVKVLTELFKVVEA